MPRRKTPESHASVAERRAGLAAAAAQLGLAFDDLPSAGLAQALDSPITGEQSGDTDEEQAMHCAGKEHAPGH